MYLYAYKKKKAKNWIIYANFNSYLINFNLPTFYVLLLHKLYLC